MERASLNFNSDELYILLDVKERLDIPFPAVSKRVTFTLTERQFPIKQSALHESKIIILGLSDDGPVNGAAASVEAVDRLAEGVVKVSATVLAYVSVNKRIDWNRYFTVKVSKHENKPIEDPLERSAMLDLMKEKLENLLLLSREKINAETLLAARTHQDIRSVENQIMAEVINGRDDALQIISETDEAERCRMILSKIEIMYSVLVKMDSISKEVASNVSSNQKKYFLNEQLKVIKKELGYAPDAIDEYEELKEKILSAKMPEEVEKKCMHELKKTGTMIATSPEATVIRNYLDWMINIPWHKKTKDNLDMESAERILNKNHYGIAKVKERMLEYLAVIKLSNNVKGNIICLVGPPGVGKTSLGQSVAEAMGRKFVRMSLGGVRDEAEIRGHRKTYIGSMPGKIISMMRRAQVMNPVFMLDEIDKLGNDYKGDPSSALLEVLDSEINNAFMDHYLEVDYDLSNVLFICTANVMHTIPPALRDRMEMIHIPGYLPFEKYEICRRFLIPRSIKNCGLKKKDDIKIEESAVREIIARYTTEAGVRNLEKTVMQITRKMARSIAAGKRGEKRITAKNLKKYLGPPMITPDGKDKKSMIGVAKGLAWTPSGGAVLSVEALIFPGTGKVQLTGQLGDVMKESANASISYLRKYAGKYSIEKDFYAKYDIHIHLPEGAIPKDGPSAGITITMALLSALRNRPLKNNFAMTGEITLRGIILPIGGLQEKIVAAQAAGIDNVIVPSANEPQIKELQKEITGNVKMHYIKTIDEAIGLLL